MGTTDNSLPETTVTVLAQAHPASQQAAIGELKPSKELLDKYIGLRDNFEARVAGLCDKMSEQLAEAVRIRDAAMGAQVEGKLKTVKQIGGAVVKEVENTLDMPRNVALGAYETYLRSDMGDYLDKAITNIQFLLNKFAPAQ